MCPGPAPQLYEGGVDQLEAGSKNIRNTFDIPYSVQVQMPTDGYTTVGDLADRWDTPEKAREKASVALGFNDFLEQQKDHTAMRVMQAVRRAAQLVKVEGTPQVEMHTRQALGQAQEVVILQNKRSTMEHRWTQKTGLPPPKID